jgi:hypothetical protein
MWGSLMKRIKGINPVLRAVGIVGAVVALAGGVTYAAFGNAVALNGTNLSTTSIGLKIWNGTTYADTAPGFNIENMGINDYSAKQLFYLKNISDHPVPVAVRLGNNYPDNMPVYDGTNYGYVKMKITAEWNNASCTAANNSVEVPLTGLYYSADFDLPCEALPVGADGNPSGTANSSEGLYSIQFMITGLTEGATSGSIQNLDLKFAEKITEQ